MIEKRVGISDRFPNLSAPTTTTEEITDEDNSSTKFKVKNFTSETNNEDNITREELKSVQKSIALFKQDLRKIFREELFRFLLLNNNNDEGIAVGNRYK